MVSPIALSTGRHLTHILYHYVQLLVLLHTCRWPLKKKHVPVTQLTCLFPIGGGSTSNLIPKWWLCSTSYWWLCSISYWWLCFIYYRRLCSKPMLPAVFPVPTGDWGSGSIARQVAVFYIHSGHHFPAR